MGKNVFDGTEREPVDRVAQRVGAWSGTRIRHRPHRNPSLFCWEACPPIKPAPGGVDLVGLRKGQLVVIGVWDVPTGALGKSSGGPRWVCRCDCGLFEIRRTRSLTNPRNVRDCCHECRNTAYLQRHCEYLETGSNRYRDKVREADHGKV